LVEVYENGLGRSVFRPNERGRIGIGAEPGNAPEYYILKAYEVIPNMGSQIKWRWKETGEVSGKLGEMVYCETFPWKEAKSGFSNREFLVITRTIEPGNNDPPSAPYP
jgi:hypothetical protein